MTPRLMMLVSLRAQVDAMIALEEADAGMVPAPGACPHPEDRRQASNNMGEEPQFFCQECKTFVRGTA